MKIRVVLGIAIASCLVSCASVHRPDGNRGLMQGMIYDYENRPVCGYTIALEGTGKTVTDLNGRFCFANVPYGTGSLSGEGPRHADYRDIFEFADRAQILHVRIPSCAWLYREADRELSEGDLGGARKNLESLPGRERETSVWKIYDAACRYLSAGDEERDDLRELAERLDRRYGHE